MLDSTSYSAVGETSVSSREMSHNFSSYVKLAESGKSFSIMRHGRAVAKLVPVVGQAPRTPKEQAAWEEKKRIALSFRLNKPYGKFNRSDAYDE